MSLWSCWLSLLSYWISGNAHLCLSCQSPPQVSPPLETCFSVVLATLTLLHAAWPFSLLTPAWGRRPTVAFVTWLRPGCQQLFGGISFCLKVRRMHSSRSAGRGTLWTALPLSEIFVDINVSSASSSTFATHLVGGREMVRVVLAEQPLACYHHSWHHVILYFTQYTDNDSKNKNIDGCTHIYPYTKRKWRHNKWQ